MYNRVYIKCNVLNNNNIILNDISFINKKKIVSPYVYIVHVHTYICDLKTFHKRKPANIPAFIYIFFNSIALYRKILYKKK